jgi:hypothetical protein
MVLEVDYSVIFLKKQQVANQPAELFMGLMSN